MITGSVLRGNVPEAGATVVVEYAADPDPPHKRAAISRSAARTGTNGRFAFCYAPRGEPLKLHPRTVDGVETIAHTRLAPDQAYVTTDVSVALRKAP